MVAANSINESTTGVVTFSGTSFSAVSGNDGVLITSHTGTPSFLAGGTTGQVLTATTNSPPTWAAPATSGTVTSVTGTTDRITVTNPTTTPVVDIAATYVGQASITTLGTVTTGTWSATNIALNKGGTNAALTADNGAIFYSTSTAGALLASTATANKVLMSGASAAPTWSTPIYPNAAAQGDLIYGSATSTWSQLAKNTTATRYLANTGTSNNPAWDQVNVANGVTGTLPIANGGTNASSMATSTGVVKYDGSSLVTSSAFKIDSSNRQVNASQPCMLATFGSTSGAVTGDGTVVTIVFATSVFDQASNYNTGTGVFTAPVAGKYMVMGQVEYDTIGAGHTACLTKIVSTSNTLVSAEFSPAACRTNLNLCSSSFQGIVTCAASDTISITGAVYNSTKTVKINTNSYLSIMLVC